MVISFVHIPKCITSRKKSGDHTRIEIQFTFSDLHQEIFEVMCQICYTTKSKKASPSFDRVDCTKEFIDQVWLVGLL